jgi:hypothetical protein
MRFTMANHISFCGIGWRPIMTASAKLRRRTADIAIGCIYAAVFVCLLWQLWALW